MSLLEVQQVTKKYPNQDSKAVNAVSFTLQKGEFVSLVGESGCGKTSLLKLIDGKEDADEGQVLFQGKKVTGPSQNLLPGHPGIEMVFQDFDLFPNQTVFQNISYFLRRYQKWYQEERIQELLDMCGLLGAEKKYPRELSGGEQQRIALARAMANSPQLLLMDEPFSNLDALLKNRLKHQIADLVHQTGTAAVFVTHDVMDALSLSDKIIIMKKGELVQVATPQTLYQYPATPYVARFFPNSNVFSINALSALLPQAVDVLPQNGQEAFLRAEEIEICPEGDALLTGIVKRLEYLGAYTQVQIQLSKDFSLRVNSTNINLSLGEQVPIRFDLKSLHYFTKKK
ncbi:ABC transporter ATP-binding protein [Rapidithrix thailandica]|uniref:ABC transporter ATP-binding protein n=1 Tax=Rapidithrix thailandica TaxID=413964 RepID=A0AAW9RW44_9BACT